MTQPAFSDNKPNEEPAKSRNLSTALVVILVFGLFAILLAVALRPSSEQFGPDEPHPSIGQVMGGFQLTPLVGDTTPVTLESLRGNVVLINFWGTWCGPCLMEFPHLVEMNERLKSDARFRFVPISCGPGGADVDAEELRAVTEAYLAKIETDLDVYSDPGSAVTVTLIKSAQLARFSYPTSVLLDREGTIQGLWQGYRPGLEADMEEAIKALLKS